MAVFPENMNKLDVNDVPGSLGRVENYIRYMTERVEFSMRNMTRNVSAAGTSSVEILILVQELAGVVSVLSNTVSGMTGEITTLNNRVSEVQDKHSALEAKQTALENKYATLETKQTQTDATISDLRSQITALAERVAQLEGGTEG